MGPNSRSLGCLWIGCCITSDANHTLDNDRFNNFVDSLIEENYPLTPDDISSLIIECDKNWTDEACADFVERWYKKYEDRI